MGTYYFFPFFFAGFFFGEAAAFFFAVFVAVEDDEAFDAFFPPNTASHPLANLAFEPTRINDISVNLMEQIAGNET